MNLKRYILLILAGLGALLVLMSSHTSVVTRETDAIAWDSAHIFRGRLIDAFDTSSAVPDASIYIADTEVDVLSDSLGNFELLLPESLFAKKFTIRIEAMGYNSVNVLVDATKINYNEVHEYALTESKSQYMNGDIQIIDATK